MFKPRMRWVVLVVTSAALATPLFQARGARQATPANLPKKESKPPKCALMGTWKGNVTIPDGADGVPGNLVLRFSGPESDLKVSGTMSNKALALQNQKATCTEFSFAAPGSAGTEPLIFSGKLSDDGRSLSGTAKRQDLATSWTLQRQ